MPPSKRKKKEPGTLFESIRKPTAPPTRQMGTQKPEQKARPAERKAKHKKDIDTDS